MALVFEVLQRTLQVFYWLIIIRALMSWFQPPSYNHYFNEFRRFLFAVTEPILAPIRRLVLPYFPGLDISPLIAILLVNVLRRWLVTLYFGLF